MQILKQKTRDLLSNVSGLAVVEAALLFPILITLSFGIHDLGMAISLNQKVISAAQITADLLARERSLTNQELSQSVAAARMALDPYNGEGLGIDIVGVRFDSENFPRECWRYTSSNMSAHTVQAAQTEGLGDEGEGLIVVTTRYQYKPHFSGTLLGTFDIEEIAYIRGRKNAYIPKDGSTC